MNGYPLYRVLLLPSREAVARHQSLAEASAWVRTYNDAMACTAARAVIAEEPAETGDARAVSRRVAA